METVLIYIAMVTGLDMHHHGNRSDYMQQWQHIICYECMYDRTVKARECEFENKTSAKINRCLYNSHQ